jgi:para-nitrobenzyl esterase
MNITNIDLRKLGLALLSLFCAFLIACSNSGGSSSLTPAPTVTTAVGQVQGLVRTYAVPTATGLGIANATSASYSVYEYRGIPYALSPTGDRRWALPEPVTSLGSGVFKAYEFGPACPQQARFNLTEASLNEDCLSINVSMPAGTKAGDNLPVLFWIHGGAFIGGSSNLYRLDKLAAEGRLVVVSINYRLGALGFMPNPAFQLTNGLGSFNGNYGLEDQRLAMKWVQTNIAAFGGDKTNVTIAGESAGAGSVCMHLTAPTQVSGLFKQAITQSAGCTANLPTVSEAQYNGADRSLWKASATIQEGLGCPNGANALSCMRSKTVAQILEQQGAYTHANPQDITSFSPVTGNSLMPNTTVPSSFKTAAANNAIVTVPMIMGGTKEELGLYVGYFWQESQAGGPPVNKFTIDGWLESFYPGPVSNPSYYSSQISSNAGYTTGLYSSDPNIVAKTFGQVLSDYNPRVGINNCLYLQTSNVMLNYVSRNPSTSAPIYQFEFDDPAAPVCQVGIAEPCPPWNMGAVHSSELNYLFPNLSNTAAINASDLAPASQGLANQMVAYWAQFARTGNPNVQSLPTWPLYAGEQTPSVLLLKPGAIAAYDSDTAHQCTAFWATPSMYDLKNAPPFP